MFEHITKDLNEKQKEAVTAKPSHLLILAGAGSGKTRVLVHRIAWLIEHDHISPHAIFAVTFTNKAAHEMRSRIEHLCHVPLSHMWAGTFHGLAHRFLRAHWQEADLPQSFQIIDADDQLRLVKRIHQSLNLDENKFPPKQFQWFINAQKEEGRRSQDVKKDDNYFSEIMLQVYQEYEKVCKSNGVVDFSELLLRTLETLQNHPTLLQHYQNRFQYIMVDEFQDTNAIQYRWLQILAGKNSYLAVVGDDDQSIYSWRGAKIENIHSFAKDYPNVAVVRLEQNYRSTQNILNAANAVIKNNSDRLGKTLWTDGNEGELVTLYAAFNERDEAYYVVSLIKNWVRNQGTYSDIAILYRSNMQSRILEEFLIDQQIAYRIYGGMKFFERAEIKDALAYLRLIVSRSDDIAFERIVNTPPRGIGNTTLTTVRENARSNNFSLWQSAHYLIEHKLLSSRAVQALKNFLNLIDTLESETQKSSLGEQTHHILHRSELMTHYSLDKTEKGLSRVENLGELINATSQFKPENDSTPTAPLSAFLAHVALETGESQAEPYTDCVNLMTLHAAKGLEFPMVIMVGLEEYLFPHRMSISDQNRLEEERRLCYVGMTRARQKLYLTYAESRRMQGKTTINMPSRFLAELPSDLVENVRPTTKVSRPAGFSETNFSRSNYSRSSYSGSNVSHDIQLSDDIHLQIGQQVKHPHFGVGCVVNYEGSGEHLRLQIKFNEGTKWLVAKFANLEIV